MIKTKIIKMIRSPTQEVALKNKLFNDPHYSIVNYRQLWESSNINFFKRMGIKNRTYLLIYKYILDKFHLSTKKGYLEMSNKQILNGINKDLKNKHVAYHVSLSQVRRAIARLTNDLVIIHNGKTYLTRRRFSKNGSKSKMIINPFMLPHTNNLDKLLLVYTYKVGPMNEEMCKFVTKYKELQIMESKAKNNLNQIIKKKKYVYAILQDLHRQGGFNNDEK